MKTSTRLVYAVIWAVFTAVGFGVTASSLVELFASLLSGPNHFKTAAFFLSGPLICGCLAYLISPKLFLNRKSVKFGIKMNVAIGIPFAAFVFIMIIFSVFLLFSQGLETALFVPLFATLGIAMSPTIWGMIFGSGFAASFVSSFYMKRWA